MIAQLTGLASLLVGVSVVAWAGPATRSLAIHGVSGRIRRRAHATLLAVGVAYAAIGLLILAGLGWLALVTDTLLLVFLLARRRRWSR